MMFECNIRYCCQWDFYLKPLSLQSQKRLKETDKKSNNKIINWRLAGQMQPTKLSNPARD